MKIKILIIGKTKEGYLQQGEKKFQKRLSHYCQFEWILVKDEKIFSGKSEKLVKLLEGERILNKLNKSDFVILLDQSGAQKTSEEFAEFLQSKFDNGIREIVFVVGGALGLGENVSKSIKNKISLSKMTFTHEMTRLILLEQLYRAFTILKREPYHHI